MVDNIETPAALITLAIIVAVWLVIGIRERRRNRAIDAEVVKHWDALARADALVILDNSCASLWHEGEGWCVCTRPYEHTGPCMDAVHGVVRQ
ncbi:hypothetical protein ACI3KS_09690 [Microbacterium sp. ZW T5_45]|uniref:hypothetical protein n=1 Tax=Microbacterium sp. ZW T5_45 TaxID=3378080 RepID=UPI003852E1A0